MRKMLLAGPGVILAFLAAGIFCLTPAPGALLDSQATRNVATPSSESAMERELVSANLKKLGWSQTEIGNRLDQLSESELRQLAFSLETVMAGGSEQELKAGKVAIVIGVILGLFIGIYFFAEAN